MLYEGRLRELSNIEKLEVAEPIQLQEARDQNLEIVYGKWFDDVRRTQKQSGADWSLLLVIQMFYIRALQSAFRRERKPHETNILGHDQGDPLLVSLQH